MRRYAQADEMRVRLQQQLREWTRSGLLTPAQRQQIEPTLKVDLRRTHLMLRLGLALFTLIGSGAAAALTFLTLDFRNDGAIAVVCLLLGAAAFAAADTLVARYRLYRFGVEEALTGVAVVLCGVGSALSIEVTFGAAHGTIAVLVALLACAIVSAAVYARFGFQYAAVAAVTFVSLTPLALDGLSEAARRVLVSTMFGLAFPIARAARHSEDELRRDDGSMVCAVALIGAYLVINIHIDLIGLWSPWANAEWFRWSSYAMTFVIPSVGLWLGIVDRDRRLIRAGMATALVTLITNKSYLGWPRQTWDPMLLGILLAGVALVLRRWLASGPDGERSGFTPVRILHRDAESLQLASLASAAIHLNPDRPAPSQPDSFGGGRSGGGGAGADF